MKINKTYCFLEVKKEKEYHVVIPYLSEQYLRDNEV